MGNSGSTTQVTPINPPQLTRKGEIAAVTQNNNINEERGKLFVEVKPSQNSSEQFLKIVPKIHPKLPGLSNVTSGKESVPLYDFFIAAHGNDNVVAGKIAESLRSTSFRGRKLRVFHDPSWYTSSTSEWLRSMYSSVVIITFISENVLNDIQAANGESNENVLLFEISLKNNVEGKCMLFSFFVENAEGKPMKFPDMSKFSKNIHKHPFAVSKSSVLDTFKALFQLQARPLQLDKFNDRLEDILIVLRKSYEAQIYSFPLAVVDSLNRDERKFPIDSGLYALSMHLEPAYRKSSAAEACIASLVDGEILHSLRIQLDSSAGELRKSSSSPDLSSFAFYCIQDTQGSSMGKVELWSFVIGEKLWEKQFLNVIDLEFYDAKSLIVYALKNQKLHLFILRVSNGQVITTLTTEAKYRSGSVPTIAIAQDKMIVFAFSDQIMLWKVPPQWPAEEVKPFAVNKLSGEIFKISISIDSSLVAIAFEGKVEVHTINTSGLVPGQEFPFKILHSNVAAWAPKTYRVVGVVALSPDNMRLFVSNTQEMKIFNLISNSEEIAFEPAKCGMRESFFAGGFLDSLVGIYAFGSSELHMWVFDASSTGIRLVQMVNYPTQYPIFSAAVACIQQSVLQSFLPPSKSQGQTDSSAERLMCAVDDRQRNEEDSSISVKTSIWNKAKKAWDTKHHVNIPADPRKYISFIALSAQCGILLTFREGFLDDQNTNCLVIEAYDIYGCGGHKQKPIYSLNITTVQNSERVRESYLSRDGTLLWYRYLSTSSQQGIICCMDVRTGRLHRAVRACINTDGTSMPHNGPNIWSFIVSDENLRMLINCSDGVRFTYTTNVLCNTLMKPPEGDRLYGDSGRSEETGAVFLSHVEPLCAFLSINERSRKISFVVANYLLGQIMVRVESFEGKFLVQGVNGHLWVMRFDNSVELFKFQATGRKLIKSGVEIPTTKYTQRGQSKLISTKTRVLDEKSIAVTFFYDANEEKDGGLLLVSNAKVESKVPNNCNGPLQVADTVIPAPTVERMLLEKEIVSNKIVDMMSFVLGFGNPADFKMNNNAEKNINSLSPESGVSDIGSQMKAAAVKLAKPTCNLWKCKIDHTLIHDIFISYRVWCDKELSMKLALHLRNQVKSQGGNRGDPVIVFLDRLCLNDGEDWECGFLNGINHSSLVVLLISKNTFLGIMEADKRQDNVLLEYEYALRMAERKQIVLLPLLVNNEDFSPCNFPDLEKFPDAKHASPKSTYPSVRGTMKALRDGYTNYPISPTDAFLDATGVILDHLHQADQMGLQRCMRLKALAKPSLATERLVKVAAYSAGNGVHEFVVSPADSINGGRSGQLKKVGDVVHVLLPADDGSPNVLYITTRDLYDWSLTKWDLSSQAVLWSVALDRNTVVGIEASHDGSFLAVATKNCCWLYLTSDGSIITQFTLTDKNVRNDDVTSIALSPDDIFLFCATSVGLLSFNLRTRTLVLKRSYRAIGTLRGVSVSQVGGNMLLGGQSSMLLVRYNKKTPGGVALNPTYELALETVDIIRSAISPCGSFAASINADGDVRSYSVDTTALLWEKTKLASPKGVLCFSTGCSSTSASGAVMLVVSTRGSSPVLCALDACSGEVQWHDKREATAFAFSAAEF